MSLREIAKSRGVEFGCAVSVGALANDPEYGPAVARECGVVVAENASKFGPLYPDEGRPDFGEFDRIVAFADANDMRLRGHALVWHSQMPAWLEHGSHSDEEVRRIVNRHIADTVGRYRGRIESWDVVNEAVSDNDGEMRDSFWPRKLGADFIEWSLREAHAADPDCQLVYNDYSIDEVNAKSDRVYALAQDWVARGVPIHAIGLQAHLELANPPDLASVDANIRRFRELGLDVLITELDIRIPEPFDDEKRRAQGDLYEGFVRTCLTNGVKRIITWGLTDRHSWVPGFFIGTGEALPLDENYEPKPAYEGIARALS